MNPGWPISCPKAEIKILNKSKTLVEQISSALLFKKNKLIVWVTSVPWIELWYNVVVWYCFVIE